VEPDSAAAIESVLGRLQRMRDPGMNPAPDSDLVFFMTKKLAVKKQKKNSKTTGTMCSCRISKFHEKPPELKRGHPAL
jgi:hypothetical protein